MNELTIGAGLNNLGNTCFFNAALQSVLHTPILSNILKKQEHSKNCSMKNRNQWCVFCEIQAKSFSPNNMIKNLKQIFKKFKLGRQEDAHQFLRYLIEGMQQSETGKLGKQRQANQLKIKKTLIFKSFGGIVKTQVFCLNCKHKSLTSQRYYDFNIDKECQSSTTLDEGIKKYFAVEKLDNNNKYYCQHCKTRSDATKRFLLEKSPSTLTFQFKRFTNSMRKIGKFIQYPLQLDIGKYLQEPHKAIMQLYAIIVHAGGSSYSGHYYAFVRVNKGWYKMDDSFVSKSSIESILNQNAYILFYEKIFQEQNKPKIIHEQRKQQTKIIVEITQSKQGNGIIKNHSEKTISDNKIPNVQIKDIPKQAVIQNKGLQKFEDKMQQIELPLLKKKKSKGQAQKELSPQMLKIKIVKKIIQLQFKIPRIQPRNFSQRKISDLRKYEIGMQKKKKIDH